MINDNHITDEIVSISNDVQFFIMKHEGVEFTFHDNLLKTLFYVLQCQHPDITFHALFNQPIIIDFTILLPDELPKKPSFTVGKVNKHADPVKIEELEELSDDLPSILQSTCLLPPLHLPRLQEAGFDKKGLLFLQAEYLLYHLNQHVIEYGSSFFWESETIETRPVLSSFKPEDCLHTGLTRLVHTALQNPCRLLMKEYPVWMVPLLTCLPEAFPFEERRGYLYVFILFILNCD